MGKKNKNKKKNISPVKTSAQPVLSSSSNTLSNIESLVVCGLIVFVFFFYSLQVNNHFALPKLLPVASGTVILLVCLFYKVTKTSLPIIPLTITLPLLSLVVWWLIGTSQALHLQTALEGQTERYNGLYTHLLMVILFCVIAHLQFTNKQLNLLKRVLYFSVGLLCIHAIAQYFNYDPVLNVDTTRPFATIGNPVTLGVMLIMIIPFLLVDVIEDKSKRLFQGLLLVMLLFTLFITGSRGPWLGLIASVFIMFFFYKRTFLDNKIILLKTLCLFTLFITLAFYFLIDWDALLKRLTLDVSIKMRLMYFSTAIEVIKDNPMFGTGFESFRLIYPEYRPFEDALIAGKDTTPTMVHNDYLQFALDNGIPALLFFIGFVASALFLIYNAIKENNKHRSFLIAIMASITAYLTQSLSGWLETPSFFLFWFMLGLGVAVALNNREVETKQRVRVGHQAFGIVGILFLLFYATQLNQFYDYEKTARKMVGYHLGGADKNADRNLSQLNNIAPNNAFYQDRIGGIYLDRLAQTKTNNHYNYRQAHKHFVHAQTLNPYNVYIPLNIMVADTIAIHKNVIDIPSNETMENITLIEEIDPNNPTVYSTRAKLYRAMGEPVKQALDLVKKKSLMLEN